MNPFIYSMSNSEKRPLSCMWANAIGLQNLSGTKISQFLFHLAQQNIDGDLPLEEILNKVENYYKNQYCVKDNEEADKVVVKMVIIMSMPTKKSLLDVKALIELHEFLFDGIEDDAGRFRKSSVNSSEPFLNYNSVEYLKWPNIRFALDDLFENEKTIIYPRYSNNQKLQYVSLFISDLWRIQPFVFGNTRVISLFTIKYLESLRFNTENDTFCDHSDYFRDALLCANYEIHDEDICQTTKYIENFLRNFVYNKENPLDSIQLSLDNGRQNTKRKS